MTSMSSSGWEAGEWSRMWDPRDTTCGKSGGEGKGQTGGAHDLTGLGNAELVG